MPRHHHRRSFNDEHDRRSIVIHNNDEQHDDEHGWAIAYDFQYTPCSDDSCPYRHFDHDAPASDGHTDAVATPNPGD